MTDEKDHEFGFEEEGFSEEEFTIEDSVAHEGSSVGLKDEVVEEFEVEIEDEPVASPPKSSLGRVLLLVLLLVAVGGGYMLLTSGDDSNVSMPEVKTVKQPIPMPSLPVSNAVAPTPVEEVKKPEPAPVTVVPATADPVPVQVPSVAPAVTETTAEPAKAEPVSVAVVKPEVTAATTGDFSVQIGAYLLQSNLEDAEKKAAQTGFPYHVERTTKKTAMTRLQYGLFAPAEAEIKLAELQKIAPSAFKLTSGDRVAVFAGSYTSIDKARRFADLVYEKGIVLDEVSIEVPIPLFKLKLGPFADRAAAEKAALAAEKVGLPAQVLKK